MMRCLSKDQKNLYQQYSRLSEEVIKASKLHQENKSSSEDIWKLISKEGIWGLPIPRQYGGHGLSWQDCVVALDGFLSNYSDTKFFTLFMSQISALYLVLHHGTESIKKRYLPRLIQGEMACLIISKHIHKLLHHGSCLNKNKNQSLYMRSNKILIHAEKNDNKIVFYIIEKKACSTPVITNKSISSILIEENKFIAKETGLSVLCDLINFERLFYGIFSVSFSEKLIQKKE